MDPLGDLLTAIDRSLNLPDVGELDIWEWLLGNHRIVGITDLNHGLIADLTLTRITERTRRTPRFAAPSLPQLNYEMRPCPPATDTFLVDGIV